MPSDRILNRFFSSAYVLKSCQRRTVYLMASIGGGTGGAGGAKTPPTL